ncbi:hypothetical protein CY0110_19512 [Crocosphaera chwakensis CCY0110]|uniref:Uncharacterized protein n=1 Tax=Crocosphaera chwakensis CCY0110 TaxID=391612 RepID=A3IJN4_9CHRO|nr:hypothetical protein CY0110_19512 [Crocosphaera chwakensis CCY0110]
MRTVTIKVRIRSDRLTSLSTMTGIKS